MYFINNYYIRFINNRYHMENANIKGENGKSWPGYDIIVHEKSI